MKIRGQEVDVEVKEELEEFTWERAKWLPNKLIAKSPFRSDSHPSFFVRLETEGQYEAGIWSDSGATDDYLAKGGFVRLLSQLRNESETETEDYLLDKYGGDIGYQSLKINLDFYAERDYLTLSDSYLERFGVDYHYLYGRGISESVQRLTNIRYDERNDCILIPWYDTKGNLCNVKFRKVENKFFWYEKEGTTPIRDLVWGLNIIYQRNIDYAVVTEAEIDSMTLLSAGIPSIGLGGASLSPKKKELLIKSPLKRIYIATDRDEVGKKIRKQLIGQLSPSMEIYTIDIPAGYKDINDVREPDKLWGLINRAKKVESFFLKF